MEQNPFVYESEKALVRIHSGKRTADERRKALEEATKAFYRAIQKGGTKQCQNT